MFALKLVKWKCDSPIPLSLSAKSEVSVALGEVGLEANSVAKLSNRNRLAAGWQAEVAALAVASAAMASEALFVAVSMMVW